jgi:hypothetical protein
LRAKPEIVELSDNTPFPTSIFEANLLRNVTPDVKTWVQLKTWVQQNPALVPGVDLQTLTLLQVLHYKDTVQRQQRGSEMNDQGFDANVSAKQLMEASPSNPEKAYRQGQGSEWADEADVQSHRRAPSEAYSDISSVHAAPSIHRGPRLERLEMPPPLQSSPFRVRSPMHEAPSIQPQDSLENHSYDWSLPEGSQDAYVSLNTPTNGLWDNDSSASWFAPPADVQLFQDPNPQPDHSNVADNKAQLSPDYNAMNRMMAPATDSSSQSLHQQTSARRARGQTMTQWWKSRKDAQKKSRENASKITTFR